jgi:hypothetical protein
VPVNCIAFDQLGTRMFAGDAAGLLTEMAVDLTPMAAAAAAAGGPGWSQGGALVEAGASASSSPNSSASGGSSSSGSGSHLGAAGAALVASVLRNGSVATQQLAGEACVWFVSANI